MKGNTVAYATDIKAILCYNKAEKTTYASRYEGAENELRKMIGTDGCRVYIKRGFTLCFIDRTSREPYDEEGRRTGVASKKRFSATGGLQGNLKGAEKQ